MNVEPLAKVHPMRRHDDHALSVPPETRTVSKLERILIPAVVAAVTAFVAVMAWQIIEPQPFQPLTYEVQRVVEIDPETGIETVPILDEYSDLIPSLYVGDLVPVIGAVCNDTDRPVDVSGTVWWNALEPQGFNIQVGAGINSIGPGCRALGPYRNPMPQEVIDYVTESGEPELFHISGQIRINESNGGTTSWVTEAFWVVPRE